MTRPPAVSVDGPHCSACRTPNPAMSSLVYRITRCCGQIRCDGHIGDMPWFPAQPVTGERGRQVWACCRGVAFAALGEPAWQPLRRRPA